MANIVRRGEDERLRTGVFDPLRLMRNLMGWSPFAGLEELAQPIAAFAPAFDIEETDDAYLIEGDVPGFKEEDVEVAVTGRQLVVRGTRQEERRESVRNQHLTERIQGSFVRTFMLPQDVDVDHVDARLDRGVLSIRLPKQGSSQPRRIPLAASGKQGNGGEAAEGGKAAQPAEASRASTRKTGGNQ